MEKRDLSDGHIIWEWTKDFGSHSAIYGIAHGYTKGYRGEVEYIYLAGCVEIDGNWRWRIEKRNGDNPDKLIWEHTSPSSVGNGKILDIAIDRNSVYVVGYEKIGDVDHWRLERINSEDGRPWSFIWDPPVGKAWGVAVDPSSIYVVGTGEHDHGWMVEKRDKIQDCEKLWSKSEASMHKAWGVAVDAGHVYVVGEGNSNNWRMEKRSLTTGELTWYTLEDPADSPSVPYGVVVDDIGVYVVGSDWRTKPLIKWRIEKRDKFVFGEVV